MLILITVLLLTLTALTLILVRLIRPGFRYSWLIAVGGAFLALVSVWVWLIGLPVELSLAAWQPLDLFAESPLFQGDDIAWVLAVSLASLTLAVLLTDVVRSDLTNPLPWAGILTLTAIGVLAVTAGNLLTLMLAWAALDLIDLATLLRAVDEPSASERAVISFSTRLIGIGLVLLANILSLAAGARLDFASLPPSVGLLLLAAAGLRLGVLPLHLPISADSASRRGVGTSLRLTSAVSSLVLLARIAPGTAASPLAPLLLVLAGAAALYSAWTWLRAPDDLSGRPFWIIALAAQAVASSLRGNPVGAAAWGAALSLAGGALFLNSSRNLWLNRILLIAAFSLSGLPFSLTASGWQSGAGSFFLTWPLSVAAQALLLAGYVRHALRPGAHENPGSQLPWTQNMLPAGIGLLLLTALLLGLFGWEGSASFRGWLPALVTVVLSILLIWLTPRLRLLNPIRAHWVRPEGGRWRRAFSGGFWNLYHSSARLGRLISDALEGEGSLMWTLLFLALFISLMLRGAP